MNNMTITPELKAAALAWQADTATKEQIEVLRAYSNAHYSFPCANSQEINCASHDILAALVRQQDADLAKAQAEVEWMRGALEPFASFYDKFNAKPIRGLCDELYAIHDPDYGAALKLSDCKAARAALNPQPKQEEKL